MVIICTFAEIATKLMEHFYFKLSGPDAGDGIKLLQSKPPPQPTTDKHVCQGKYFSQVY